MTFIINQEHVVCISFYTNVAVFLKWSFPWTKRQGFWFPFQQYQRVKGKLIVLMVKNLFWSFILLSFFNLVIICITDVNFPGISRCSDFIIVQTRCRESIEIVLTLSILTNRLYLNLENYYNKETQLIEVVILNHWNSYTTSNDEINIEVYKTEGLNCII